MKRSGAPSQKVGKLPKFMPPVKVVGQNHDDKRSNDSHRNVSSSSSRVNGVLSNIYKKAEVIREVSSFKSPAPPDVAEKENQSLKRYFSVLWCKRSMKKHKKWEGDAVMIASERSVVLFDLDGKEIGKSTGYKSQDLVLEEGSQLVIGSKEVEVQDTINEDDYLSGKCFAQQSNNFEPEVSSLSMKATSIGHSLLLNKSSNQSGKNVLKPRFDPNAVEALVMPRQPSGYKSSVAYVEVVVDPHLSSCLRPHQRDGVSFLYSCVMGYNGMSTKGAILADEMGLGKTLQIITIIWTLLKQNPVSSKPVLKNILVVTPGSLVKNWVNEFKKWLGTERLNVFAVSGDKKAQDFKCTQVAPVMIVSYEMFVRYCDAIKQSKFDMLVCDEGHRLKNNSIKASTLLQSLNITRKVLLTGTPIQNDLNEFYSLIDFCNPGVLGSQASFHKIYEEPIVLSKQPNCTAEEKRVGEERAKELARITSSFILRRTSDVNQRYLPPKTEYVLFCKPSEVQIRLYQKLLASCQVPALLNYTGDGNPHLIWISNMKKLCNYPPLIAHANLESMSHNDEVFETSMPCNQGVCTPGEGSDISQLDTTLSGKLHVLYMMLQDLDRQQITERIVIVSNYTKTLDLVELLCKQVNRKFLRLDGQTPVNKRQSIVDNFNSSYGQHDVFLLSSKAGGVGLNLIGANRLVLFDIDWNPATDLQAMARVWRDGQRKPVYIYRLLTAGSIEEKIYQRQVSKMVLGNTVVEAAKDDVKFSKEDLKDLLTFRPDAECDTHDMLTCDCQQVFETAATAAKPIEKIRSRAKDLTQLCMSELQNWRHMNRQQIMEQVQDRLIRNAIGGITFVFASKVADKLSEEA